MDKHAIDRIEGDLIEICAELGCADNQIIPSDDQLIAWHIRNALARSQEALRTLYAARRVRS